MVFIMKGEKDFNPVNIYLSSVVGVMLDLDGVVYLVYEFLGSLPMF
jgi:hypothetical protein